VTGRAVLVLALLALGCARAAEPAGEPVLDALFPDGRRSIPVDDLAERVQLAPGEHFAVVELARDAGTSHHVVAIRDRERPHRHDRHDLWVVMLRGHGTWRLGEEVRPVGEGSILYVPRGTVHAFANASDAPARAYAVYSPPFDGADRVLVED
jgi:mannose-6-phosphate isomerase-like protein (cupin superfamily)